MFQIRYEDGGTQTITLQPRPTSVEYPERRNQTIIDTADGSHVLQRPIKDNRSRRWIWSNYRPTIVSYENQWAILETLEATTRAANGLDPVVSIWEDESNNNGGFERYEMDLVTPLFTDVKFVSVTRVIREGGGPVVYETSSIEFKIEDITYTYF